MLSDIDRVLKDRDAGVLIILPGSLDEALFIRSNVIVSVLASVVDSGSYLNWTPFFLHHVPHSRPGSRLQEQKDKRDLTTCRLGVMRSLQVPSLPDVLRATIVGRPVR